MKHLVLLLLITLSLFASQEKKIVLATYFNEKEALQGLKKSQTLFDATLSTLQEEKQFNIALYKSKKYYILALDPFQNIAAAREILPYAKKFYPSAFLSNHSKKINTLIASKTAAKKEQKEPLIKEVPIVFEEEFLKPITVDEILNTAKVKTEPKPVEHNVTQKKLHVKNSASFSSVLYFIYALLTLLIITLVMLVLKNSTLKHQLKDRDKILKAHLNRVDKEEDRSGDEISSVELCQYLRHALLHESEPLEKILNSVDDILNVDALLHGKNYVKNREFQLSEITRTIAKRHGITFEVDDTIAKTLIGDIEILERIFLRLSYLLLQKVTLKTLSYDEESIELEFHLEYLKEVQNSIDTRLSVELIHFIDGSVTLSQSSANAYITHFKLPFSLVQDSTFRVKRP
jgi:hypothetical protein